MAVVEVWAHSWAISVFLVYSCSSVSFPCLILYCITLRMFLLKSSYILYWHVRWSLSRFGILFAVVSIRNPAVFSIDITALVTSLDQMFCP